AETKRVRPTSRRWRHWPARAGMPLLGRSIATSWPGRITSSRSPKDWASHADRNTTGRAVLVGLALADRAARTTSAADRRTATIEAVPANRQDRGQDEAVRVRRDRARVSLLHLLRTAAHRSAPLACSKDW